MDSPDAWWARVEQKRSVAERFKDDRVACREAFVASGAAVEFALKAVIMKRERLNRWPDKEDRPQLHVHNLRSLLGEAQIAPNQMPPAVRINFRIVATWSRGADYVGRRMPRKVARDFYEAAFGPNGVVTWLKRL